MDEEGSRSEKMYTIEYSQYEGYWLMGSPVRNNNQQIKTKRTRKNSVRTTKKAQKMVPICAGGGRRKNSKAKISHAEKDMKNLPRSIQYYIVKKI